MNETLEQVISNFEHAPRGIPQAHMAARLVAELRAAISADRAARAPAESVLEDAVALARYKVVPAHKSMFYRFAVVAGDGKQQLYLGCEAECHNMARKFAGAFLDGAFYQTHVAAAPQPTTSTAHPIDPAVSADLERSDWTPEEALHWYAAGKHYDTVPNGDGTSSARILDNGAVASNALKHLSREYAEHKGDAALLEPSPSPAPAQPGQEGERDYPPLPECDATTVGLGEVWNRHSMRAYVDAARKQGGA